MKNIALFSSGAVDFAFDANIYGCKAVKNLLRAAQHEKCCYCEKRISDSYADVEHFRPKTGVTKPGSRTLSRPGYFWLAYDWDNLLVSCEVCNRSHKKNKFPLVAEAGRADGATRTTQTEQPLLIHPVREDPEAFLSFRDEYPYALNGNSRGEATIKVLKLDRSALNEERRTLLQTILTLKTVVAELANTQHATRAKDLLLRMQSDAGEYSACVRAYLSTNP